MNSNLPLHLTADDPFFVDTALFGTSDNFGEFVPMSEIKRVDEHRSGNSNNMNGNHRMDNNDDNDQSNNITNSLLNQSNFSKLINLDNSMNSVRSLNSQQLESPSPSSSNFTSISNRIVAFPNNNNNSNNNRNNHNNNNNQNHLNPSLYQQQHQKQQQQQQHHQELQFDMLSIASSEQSLNQQPINFDHKIEENLLHMAMYCNQTLRNFGFSGLGQFPSTRSEDAMQTLNSIYELLQQRQRDIDFRTNIAEKSAKLENNYKISQEKNEKQKIQEILLDFQKRNISSREIEISRQKKQIGGLENQLGALEERSKREIIRLQSERDESQKNLLKLQQKSAQMIAEMRKKESETNRVKEQMKKLTADKFDKSVRNTIEITQSFSSQFHTSSKNATNATDDFTDTINQQAISMNHTLLQENQAFRNTLMTLHNDLNAFVNSSKEEYIRKKMSDETSSKGGVSAGTTAAAIASESKKLQDYYKQKLPDVDLIYFKEECFNLPYERLGSMVMQVFRENFKCVKLFLSTISCLIYSHNYFNELGDELSAMQSKLLNIRTNLDVTKLLYTDTSSDYSMNNNNNNNQNNNGEMKFTQAPMIPTVATQQQLTQQRNLRGFSSDSFVFGTSAAPSNSSQNTNTPKTSSSSSQSTAGVTHISATGNTVRSTSMHKPNNNLSSKAQGQSGVTGYAAATGSSSTKNVPSNNNRSSASMTSSSSSGKKQQSSLNSHQLPPSQQSSTMNPSSLNFKKKNSDNNNINNQNASQMMPSSNASSNLNSTTKGMPNQGGGSRIQAIVMEKLNDRLRNGEFAKKVDECTREFFDSDSMMMMDGEQKRTILNAAAGEQLHVGGGGSQQNNNNNNNDLSLSFVSRVSFRDVPGGTEYDDQLFDGIQHQESEQKSMNMDIRRWQNVLNEFKPNAAGSVIMQNFPASSSQQNSLSSSLANNKKNNLSNANSNTINNNMNNFQR